MFVVRKQQVESLQRTALLQFEDDMVLHLGEFTPAHARSLGEPGLREVIRLGIARAGSYGFTHFGTMRFYLEMMFLFGSDFDSDPQLPWAGSALRDPATPDQTMRADRLYGHAMTFIDIVAGPRNVHEQAALRRAAAVRFEDLPAPGDDFDDEVVRRLIRLHPEKCAFVGEAGLQALIPRADALTERHALPREKGVALLIGLMFTFGHGCMSDPQYPWIEDILTPLPPDADGGPRAERLFKKFVAYLSRAVSSLN